MFGLTRRRRSAVTGTDPAPPAPPEPASGDAFERGLDAPQHAHLLQRWMSLADIQQRVIRTLAAEISRTSAFVETEADSLSERFQRLAVTAQQQTTRIDSLANLAIGIELEGRTIRVDQVAELFGVALNAIVAKIQVLSQDSTSIVDALNSLGASVRNVGRCNAGIDAINASLNMLALNARIEGERAGAAGGAFRVVANEVYEVSKTTQSLAATMKTELKTMTDGIQTSHDKLQRVATINSSRDDVQAKDELETLLKALVERNGHLQAVVASAAKDSTVIADDIAGMITGIQFQDKTKQRLEHVVDTLRVLGEALDQITASTAAELPELGAVSAADTTWVKDLLSRYTLSEMRQNIVAQMLEGKPLDWAESSAVVCSPASDGSVELF